MKRRLPRRLLLSMTALPASRRAHAGDQREETLPSRALGRALAYTVHLPAGYESGRMRYPVLYFLPGLNASRSDWAELTLSRCVDDAVAYNRLPPPIVVVPQLGASWGVDGEERMQTALLDELMPHIERSYRILPGREARVLAGISAGGFAALRLALLRPGHFAAVALLSPAIYHPEPPAESGARRSRVFGAAGFDPALWRAYNYPALLPAFLSAKVDLPVYIGTGASDRLGIAAHAHRLHETLREHGRPAELHVVPGDHTYAVWKTLLSSALPFLLSRVPRPAPEPPSHSAALP